MSLDHYLPQGRYPSNCDVFRAAADDTWNRIAFSRTTPRLKIHETTITQNLVYELGLLQSKYPLLGFTLFESRMEKTNGNDLELCVLHNDGQLYTYAMQAKIIYHPAQKKSPYLENGNYPQMRHYIGKARFNQVDLLIDYAAKPSNRYIPVYLLYNCIYKSFSTMGYRPSAYGCSVVSAYYLKSHHALTDGNLSDKVSFAQLHPTPAIPWEELVCDLVSLDATGLAKQFELPATHPLYSRPVREILTDPDWLVLKADLTTDEKRILTPTVRQERADRVLDRGLSEDYFRPKFRMVVAQTVQAVDHS